MSSPAITYAAKIATVAQSDSESRRSTGAHSNAGHPSAHFALGNVYLFQRRFDDALSEFELALRLNPNFLPNGY